MNSEAFAKLAPIFIALGDPQRQQIVLQLSSHHGTAVQTIADSSSISRPAISHHLKVLRQAGLVEVEQVGRERLYRLQLEAAVADLETLTNGLKQCFEKDE